MSIKIELNGQTKHDVFFPAVVFPAGRVVKRPKQEDCQRLHEATIQLLEQQQNLCSLLREVGVSE